MINGIKRKIFRWTDFKSEVRQRILFCAYRLASISGQKQDTFIAYLNALHDNRYMEALSAKTEIIMVDDNLNALRAEAICRNLGLEHSWCSLKKVTIDERILEYRNAIAHGSRRLRSGDYLDLLKPEIAEAITEARGLIRESKNRFQNAIIKRDFLSS